MHQESSPLLSTPRCNVVDNLTPMAKRKRSTEEEESEDGDDDGDGGYTKVFNN